MGTTFLKLTGFTGTDHQDVYVKAEDILIVDWVDTTHTAIALSGGGLITLENSSVAKGNNYIALGIYSALDKALQGAESKGSSFTQTVSFEGGASLVSAAFS